MTVRSQPVTEQLRHECRLSPVTQEPPLIVTLAWGGSLAWPKLSQITLQCEVYLSDPPSFLLFFTACRPALCSDNSCPIQLLPLFSHRCFLTQLPHTSNSIFGACLTGHRLMPCCGLVFQDFHSLLFLPITVRGRLKSVNKTVPFFFQSVSFCFIFFLLW